MPGCAKEKTLWRRCPNEADFIKIIKTHIKKEEKLALAREALDGGFFEQGWNGMLKSRFSQWLQWVQSDDSAAVAWWHWVMETKPKKDAEGKDVSDIADRDKYIIEIWRTMDALDGKNRAAKEQIVDDVGSWSYYQDHFFNWFMNRFDIVHAREVFNNTWLCKYIHIPISIISIGAVVQRFFLKGYVETLQFCCCALTILFALVAGWCFTQLKLIDYFQSLIPRLAVTTGIGYLFMLSANGLVSVIYGDALPPSLQISISAVLLFAVWIYVVINIQRRVRPRLPLEKAFLRSAHLMLIVSAYSAIGLFLTSPVLFCRNFLNIQENVELQTPSIGCLLIVGSLALAIGVVLQLVWEDKPVTEPL